MTTPKRVWSNKKTVWEWKKWVWKVWDEIATYDGTWSKAEWQLSTYWTSWENLSDSDNLQVYDSSSATEIWTVAENQWGDTPTLTINDELSDTTGTVGWQVTVYFSTTWNPWILYSDDPDILTVVDTDTTGWEWWTNKVTYSVGGTWTTTVTITATKNGQAVSDSIQITCSEAAVTQEWWAETATVNNEECQLMGEASDRECYYNYFSSAERDQDTTEFNVSIWIVPSNATIDIDRDLRWEDWDGVLVNNIAVSNWVLSFTMAPETAWEEYNVAQVTVKNMNTGVPTWLTFTTAITINYE